MAWEAETDPSAKLYCDRSTTTWCDEIPQRQPRDLTSQKRFRVDSGPRTEGKERIEQWEPKGNKVTWWPCRRTDLNISTNQGSPPPLLYRRAFSPSPFSSQQLHEGIETAVWCLFAKASQSQARPRGARTCRRSDSVALVAYLDRSATQNCPDTGRKAFVSPPPIALPCRSTPYSASLHIPLVFLQAPEPLVQMLY